MNPQKKIAEKEPYISFLGNSVFFFIQCAYLITENKHYRLVVIHQGNVLMDNIYDTVRGARIAFSKAFKKKSWDEQIKAEWTVFYNPEREWLEKTAKVAGRR